MNTRVFKFVHVWSFPNKEFNKQKTKTKNRGHSLDFTSGYESCLWSMIFSIHVPVYLCFQSVLCSVMVFFKLYRKCTNLMLCELSLIPQFLNFFEQVLVHLIYFVNFWTSNRIPLSFHHSRRLLSLLFSPHGKVLRFINKHFRGFSRNLPLVMHCVFSKAHVNLHKFQMCPRLEKGGSVFLLILSPFLPIFLFFSIRIGICLSIPPSLDRELSEDHYGSHPSAEPVPMWVDSLSFIQRDLLSPLLRGNFFISFLLATSISLLFFAESEVVLLLWKRSILFQLSFGYFLFSYSQVLYRLIHSLIYWLVLIFLLLSSSS